MRENKLMTQAQLARKARVALRTIHSVEKGMNCRMDTKRKILLALGLAFEDKDMVFPPLRRVIEEMIPCVTEAGLASYCDVFCEQGVFDLEESRRILLAARDAGLGLKLHPRPSIDRGDPCLGPVEYRVLA